jgi:hypothetical protein
VDLARGDLSGVLTLLSGYTKAFDGISVEAFEANALEILNNARDAMKAGLSSAYIMIGARCSLRLPPGERMIG